MTFHKIHRLYFVYPLTCIVMVFKILRVIGVPLNIISCAISGLRTMFWKHEPQLELLAGVF
jgi:hypothetical protein